MTAILMPHIAARLFGEPLLIEPTKLAAILVGLGGRIVEGGFVLNEVQPVEHKAFAGGRPSEQFGRVGDPLGRFIEGSGAGGQMIDRVRGARGGLVGIIPIEGTLVNKGKFLGQSSGETSYEGIQTRVARARRDSDIKGVVYEIDSFGGSSAGAFETARMMAALSAEKPTLAILTDHAYSAGYLMASAARQIVMPETGGAGHIGAIMMHADLSQKLEKDGVKVTLVASGAHKADGHPALPLAEEVRARMQAGVDRSRDLFAALVGEFRGARLAKPAALATEAMTYLGEEAVAAGLVDGVIEPNKAFSAFLSNF